MAKSFYALGTHLAAGRLNFTTSQISCMVLSTDVRTQLPTIRSTHKMVSDIYSGWRASEILPATVAATVATYNPVDDPTLDEGVTRVVVPDISLTNAQTYPITAYVLVFYVDTGSPSSSPLLGYDDIGPLVLGENSTYVYKSSPDGLIQITLP